MTVTAPHLVDITADIERVLVVIAHPDDAEFGAAGTIARLTAAGAEVRYLVMTDGASGSSDPSMTRERLELLRRAEQEAACEILGVKGIEWGGFSDGYLEPSIPARRVVAATIRRHRPQVVITLDPEMRFSAAGYVNHPDHRAVGDLVLHSINPAASTRLWDLSLLQEGLEPWDISQLWLIGFGDGPARVDITETFETKLAALRCHVTQIPGDDPEPRIREWASRVGADVGVAMAEPFRMFTL